ncbi:MAG: hypothetical protein EBY39_04310 [Flavobacteriia bacterium]|nr:hypothetical protein [Flavobacteriia bacterium]
MVNKIPVFLHIPKNAGTYLQAVAYKYLNRNNEGSNNYLRKITVETPEYNLTVFCNFKSDYWKTDEHMKRHPVSVMRNVNNPRAGWCLLPTLEAYIKNKELEVLFIVAEPTQQPPQPTNFIDLRPSIFQAARVASLSGKDPVNFCFVRDPFSRAFSIYNYLQSSISKHEDTHGALDHLKSFGEYVSSHYLEDSWTVRGLTGASFQNILDSNWVKEAISFLENHKFIVSSIKNFRETSDDIFKICFNPPILEEDYQKIHENKGTYKQKLTLDDLTDSEREKFLHRTSADYEFYQHFAT